MTIGFDCYLTKRSWTCKPIFAFEPCEKRCLETLQGTQSHPRHNSCSSEDQRGAVALGPGTPIMGLAKWLFNNHELHELAAGLLWGVA